MPYRTRFTLTSGDHRALTRIVDELREVADRKGAEVTGPHPKPTDTIPVPLYKTAGGDEFFRRWQYDVYRREIAITGRESVAERLARRSFPASVAVEVTIEQVDQPATEK